MFGRIMDSYERHQYLAVGDYLPSKEILKMGELLTITFDGKAILVAFGTFRNSEYQGVFNK